ncbi:hypothetical protein V5N11_011411 [Cardamine amara subsp. amara]|uniref:Uncharacterized protein n=1 Tax=Cardamine amara subsp. amara TaxID=228776 RepID=A0ABD1ABQ0_CARAN
MVSRHEGTLYSRKRDFTICGEEFHNSFKRGKQEDQSQSNLFNERPNSESMRSITFDFELHLHTPLPSDWQTKGYSRTSEDHRTYSKDPAIVERPKMSLDLELNLSPSYSPLKATTKRDESSNHNETVSPKGTGDDDDVDHKEQEMVTKVCMKCHMLVMLCTSTPVCPNCKFMHPHDHSSTKLFKPSNLLKLLC